MDGKIVSCGLQGGLMKPLDPGDSDVFTFLGGLAVVLLGWLGVAFGIGRKLTKIEAGIDKKISATNAKLAYVAGQQERNIQAIEKLINIESLVMQVKEKQTDYDATLTRIDTFLLTREGEPRFITYPAHDIISENCRKQIVMELSYLRKDSEEMKEQWQQHSAEVKSDIKVIAENITRLSVSHAILSGRRSTDTHGQREEDL